jgi:probable selenium-dependent hydroxylase accessory protein YqeC
LKLAEALHMAADEVVALVGGGGKTSAMFRLAGEVAEKGGSAITTTTTRIFGAQIALAPAHVSAADATRESIAAALAVHRHVLVIGATNARDGKADGVSPDLFRRLRAWFPGVCVLNEADGSRMRPFKAPAAHEPVIPVETTLVVPLVGADVFGRPLDAESVHRPELVSALSGTPLGAPITPETVARVLAHREGGCKGVPSGARVVVLINKVESLPDRAPAHETAERLLREPAIHSVVLTNLRGADPVLELWARQKVWTSRAAASSGFMREDACRGTGPAG